MQTKDIYGKTLSNSFESAISNVSQYIKPRAVIDLQDIRHLSNITSYTIDEGDSYVSLNATASSLCWSLDRNEFDITGDIDIVARVKLADWTPSGNIIVASKWFITIQSWQFIVNTNGSLGLSTTANGSTGLTQNSAIGPFIDAQTYWIRATLDVVNGANRVYTFYWAYDQETEPTTWNTLSTHTVAGTTSIYSGAAQIEIGSQGGGFNLLNGVVYRVIIRNGIAGSIVADFNPNDTISNSDTTWYSSSPTGELWNRGANATLVSKHYDPLTLGVEKSAYLDVNISGALSLDRSEFDVTTELDIVVRAQSYYWGAGGNNVPDRDFGQYYVLVGKWADNVSQLSYVFYQNDIGRLGIKITSDGSTVETADVWAGLSSSFPGLGSNDNEPYWLRVTVQTSFLYSFSGVSGRKFTFYIARDNDTEPDEWFLLGTVGGTGTNPIFNSNSPLTIGYTEGKLDALYHDPMKGKIYYAEVRSGLTNPVVVAKFDPRDAKQSSESEPLLVGPTFISSSPTKEKWILNSSNSLSFSTLSTFKSQINYFNSQELVNGTEYETFAWGICGAKDSKGHTITASGKYVAMPTTLDENLKYGWWGSVASDSNKNVPASEQGVRIKFDNATLNKIKVVTSEIYGPVSTFSIRVYSASLGLVLDKQYTFNIQNGEFEKLINLNTVYSDINLIVVRAITTFYANDYPRFVSILPIYQVDISDNLVSINSSRIRDLHETSLPISGTSQTSADITLDNTSKLFTPSSNTSTYGKYLAKDIKVHLSQGWKTLSTAPDTVSTFLTSNMAASGETYININNASDFPNGDISNTGLESNYYIVTIDEGNNSEEKILVKRKISNLQLEIAQRGYDGTTAIIHNSNAIVRFDPFEYVPIGNFYVDEISTSSSDMTVSISLQDELKFLNDKTIDYGYFRQDTTVPQAVSDLLMLGNFPRKNIITFNRYSDKPVIDEAILQFKCDDLAKNTANTNIYQGLRLRVYVLPEPDKKKIFDMSLDARETELTDLEKAMGVNQSVSPSFTTIKSNINLANYTLTTDYAAGRNTYYQGVYDGYWTPLVSNTSPGLVMGFGITGGGGRLYLDDVLVIDKWNSEQLQASNLSSNAFGWTTVQTTAGTPIKLRLEFFHGPTNELDLSLAYYNASNAADISNVIPSTQFLTNVLEDNIGSKAIFYSNTTSEVVEYPQKNNGVPTTYVTFQQPSSIDWNINDGSIFISNSHANGNVLSYIRIPYNTSINPASFSHGDWSAEVLFKAPNGAYGGQGEYISSYSNANSLSGFEFFYISSTNHGFKSKVMGNTSAPAITVTSNTAMPNGGNSWNHVVVTYSKYNDKLSYYVNGTLHASQSCNTQTPSFIFDPAVSATSSITIGGRGSSYTSGSGAVLPTSSVNASGINLYLDEFSIYKKCLTADEVKRRYVETKIKEIRRFPFLYAFKESIYQSIQNISFGDLGRLYINELGQAIYESYYALFESEIDQHANVQQTLSDSEYIINASLTKTLQVNSVIVKVSGVASRNNAYQSIWRAPDNTTLGVVALTSNITANSTVIPASSFDLIPFPKSGYIIIDNEIIKYSGINSTSFLAAERGMFGTTAIAHYDTRGSSAASADFITTIREVRAYDFEFDKTPAFSVKDPFITGILFEEPDEIQIINWSYSPYKGNLIVAASDTISSNSVVFLEGVHPVTGEVAYTSIAGIPVQINENTGQIKEQKAVNSENRRKYGLKEVIIESPFITDLLFAQELADFIISKLAEPIPILSTETVLTPKLQVGDRIRLSSLDQFSISNVDYWVTGITVSIGSGYSQNLELRKVV